MHFGTCAQLFQRELDNRILLGITSRDMTAKSGGQPWRHSLRCMHPICLTDSIRPPWQGPWQRCHSIHTYMHIHMCIYIYSAIYMYIHVYMYEYIHIYIYTYTCIYMYIDGYIHVYVHSCMYIVTPLPWPLPWWSYRVCQTNWMHAAE